MPPHTSDQGGDLLSLFERPIERVSQLMRRSNLPGRAGEFEQAWGGQQPVLVIHFGGSRNHDALVLGCPRDRIEWRLVETGRGLEKQLAAFVHDLKREAEEDEENVEQVLGLFDLDIVVSPVPEWHGLLIAEATVVWRNTPEADGSLIGFCLWINLGVRMGCFVPPYNGLTLCFNDSCDLILSRAKQAEERGLVTIHSREYAGRETSTQMKDIDWFDWLSDADA